MYSKVEIITPDVAMAYLERNTNNRPKKEKRIKMYAADMKSDVSRLLNKSRGWVRERLEVKKDGITVEALAMKLAREFV